MATTTGDAYAPAHLPTPSPDLELLSQLTPDRTASPSYAIDLCPAKIPFFRDEEQITFWLETIAAATEKIVQLWLLIK